MPDRKSNDRPRGRNRKRKSLSLRSVTSKRPSRLLLVNDHTISLAALRLYLQRWTRCRVITLRLDRIEAIRKAKVAGPDVVLLDMRMLRFDGASVTKLLLDSAPDSKVIAFNGAEDHRTLLAMLRAGARGYVTHACSSLELLRAVDTVRRGEFFFSPSVLRMIAHDFTLGKSEVGREDERELTERERKILAFIADGLCNKEMASALGLSVRTVEKYRESLMAKLQIKTVSGLTKFAIRNGIATLD